MQLTRERKVLLGFLGAGLAALGADRFLLGGGGPASAEASDAPVAATPAEPAVTATTNPPAARVSSAASTPAAAAARHEAPLAHRFAALDLPASDRDLFAAPPSWAPAADLLTADPEATRQFFQHHRIDAILADDGIAVIDGRRVRVGDTIDGYVLVELTGNDARFRRAAAAATK